MYEGATLPKESRQRLPERQFLDSKPDTQTLGINFLRYLWQVICIWQYINTHRPKSLSCPAQNHKEQQSAGEGQRLPPNREWQKYTDFRQKRQRWTTLQNFGRSPLKTQPSNGAQTLTQPKARTSSHLHSGNCRKY